MRLKQPVQNLKVSENWVCSEIVQSGWSAELRGAWAEITPAQEAGAWAGSFQFVPVMALT